MNTRFLLLLLALGISTSVEPGRKKKGGRTAARRDAGGATGDATVYRREATKTDDELLKKAMALAAHERLIADSASAGGASADSESTSTLAPCTSPPFNMVSLGDTKEGYTALLSSLAATSIAGSVARLHEALGTNYDLFVPQLYLLVQTWITRNLEELRTGRPIRTYTKRLVLLSALNKHLRDQEAEKFKTLPVKSLGLETSSRKKNKSFSTMRAAISSKKNNAHQALSKLTRLGDNSAQWNIIENELPQHFLTTLCSLLGSRTENRLFRASITSKLDRYGLPENCLDDFINFVLYINGYARISSGK